MTTLRGTLRSTETREAEGSGDTIGEAREAAIAALDLDGFQLLQVNTVTSKATGESTVKAIARSTALRPHEATGANYDAALAAYRNSVPEGWQAQNMHEVAE
ncbi:hypothetical protein Csp2054_00505 [Curtobacterium sp. 'Ferrero']|uniref:hypothetical protein n=1 Tax=Curtobacterium sp. 'Ferrero' TaxID=2033654 RepID=UPI000BCD3A0C|nr:hypothetical protein [Curtobacterium sp. 'Ferrero']PCN49481.1 hypothetical protein Csp2054_00505 [Curtobacterium sp. 'Ferrero']